MRETSRIHPVVSIRTRCVSVRCRAGVPMGKHGIVIEYRDVRRAISFRREATDAVPIPRSLS
jgi:hypothetical protein